MHIGIYIQNPPKELGGGFTFEEQILRSLIVTDLQRGHELTVIAKYDLPAAPPKLPQVKWVSLSNAVHGAKRPLHVRAKHHVAKLFEGGRGKTDALIEARHLNSQTEYLRNLGIECVLSLVPWEVPSWDIPYVSVVWDLTHRTHPFFPEVSEGSVWEARERLFGRVLHRAAYVITGTKVGQDEIERFYQVPAERICRIPHPTPDYVLGEIPHSVVAREKFGLKGDYLFYPAQLWPHKNHINLIEAVKVLREKEGLDFHLALSGSDAGNRRHIEQMAKKFGVKEKVHLLGFVSREEILSLYQNAVALTYLSFCGPENLPPLEAFALGCPVVASRIPGAEEQLENAALLVDPTSPAEIASAVGRIHRDASLRSHLIERGKERAKRFTTADFAEAVFRIMEQFGRYRRCWGVG